MLSRSEINSRDEYEPENPFFSAEPKLTVAYAQNVIQSSLIEDSDSEDLEEEQKEEP